MHTQRMAQSEQLIQTFSSVLIVSNFELNFSFKIQFQDYLGKKLQNVSLWSLFFFFFFNWVSFHARLNSHYHAWSYKKKKHKKLKTYRKCLQKEPTVKRYLLIFYLKLLRSQVKEKHSLGREYQSLAVRGKKLLTYTFL